MAGHGSLINSRTYWRYSDSKGQPVTSPLPPQPTGGNLLSGAKVPADATQYQEQTYEDGTKVVSRWDPTENQWAQESIEVDPHIAAQYGRENPNAQGAANEQGRNDRQAAAIAARAALASQNQQAAYQRAMLQAQNRQYNQPIEEPTGQYEHSKGQTTPVTRTVTQAQAKYDFDIEQANRTWARQQELDRITQANQQKQLLNQEFANQIAQGHLTVAQAIQQANQASQQIQAQLEAQRNAISARAVDATMRGQDISAAVQQRGQDLSYATGLAGQGTQLADTLLRTYVPTNQLNQFNASMQGLAKLSGVNNYPNVQGGPLPFSPTLPLDLARQAQAQAPAQLTLPDKPAPVDTTKQLTLPGQAPQAA